MGVIFVILVLGFGYKMDVKWFYKACWKILLFRALWFFTSFLIYILVIIKFAQMSKLMNLIALLVADLIKGPHENHVVMILWNKTKFD